jgi:hypothetical protein
MKKVLLIAFLSFGLVSMIMAQSLSIVSADEVVYVNSTAVNDYFGKVEVKNTSTTDIDVYAKRKILGSNLCAFDSAYFCWDFCYFPDTDQSIGTLEIKAGETNSIFSGHVYSTTTGVSCQDSIRYTFWNSNDVNDSVSIVVVYAASDVFSVEENTVGIDKIYPNPANQFVFIELSEQNIDGLTVELYNLLGSKVRSTVVNSNRIQLNVANLHAGIYLCTISKNGEAVETRKIVVKH